MHTHTDALHIWQMTIAWWGIGGLRCATTLRAKQRWCMEINSWLIFTVTTWVNAEVYFKIPHNCPSRVVWPFNGVFISLQRRIQCARKDLIIALIALIECWMLSMPMRTFSLIFCMHLCGNQVLKKCIRFVVLWI